MNAQPEVILPPRTAQQSFAQNMCSIGLQTPARRFVCAGLATTAGLLIFKPSYCFDEDGELRKCKQLDPHDPDATNYHFFLAPLVAAIAFAQLL
jgi:hypothetical protein